MPTKYWLITNRNVKADDFGKDRAANGNTFWTAESVDSAGRDLQTFATWKRTAPKQFRDALTEAARDDRLFPTIAAPEDQEQQSHVTLFIHGYNNSWQSAVERYQKICKNLFSGPKSLGICILYAWPSNGWPQDYLPDRADARESALDLADVLTTLYDWLMKMQDAAAKDEDKACRAKTSIIAHSMGASVFRKRPPGTGLGLLPADTSLAGYFLAERCFSAWRR